MEPYQHNGSVVLPADLDGWVALVAELVGGRSLMNANNVNVVSSNYEIL